ncbi:MAG: hypothetical protein ACFFCM_19195 [Promethearchaeota archaeon]
MNQSTLKNQVVNDHQFYRDKLKNFEGVKLNGHLDGIDLFYYDIPIEIKETRQSEKYQKYRKFLVKKKDLASKFILFIVNKRYIYAVQTEFVELLSNINDVNGNYIGFYLSKVKEIALFKGRNIFQILKQIKKEQDCLKEF